MEKKIKLKDGRIILVDSDFLTVAKRREIKDKYTFPAKEVVEDKTILAALVKTFKDKPPTQKDLFKGYLSLLKPVEKDISDQLIDSLAAGSCVWLEEGEPNRYKPVTDEEYLTFPFELGEEIKKLAFSTEEQSFLVVTPD